jgi:hypothetical protein
MAVVSTPFSDMRQVFKTLSDDNVTKPSVVIRDSSQGEVVRQHDFGNSKVKSSQKFSSFLTVTARIKGRMNERPTALLVLTFISSFDLECI